MSGTIQTEKIGKLGFGYMRLPRKNGKFDYEQINKMADAFIASGGNYFDTAYVYTGAEVAFRESVVKRYPRESYLIATKLPLEDADTIGKLDERFKTSLERLGVDYVDFYLLHGIDAKASREAEALGTWDYMADLKAKGLVRHIGFSFHAPPEELEEILSKHPDSEFVQLQLNYQEWDDPVAQARRMYEIARKYEIPIIVMEPLLGGLLASVDSPIADLLRGAKQEASLASWALRFVAQLDGVFVTLSGMSDYEQLADNVATYANLTPLSEDEQAILDKAVGIINSIPRIGCTSCRYCIEGCPSKINIPDLIDVYNSHLVHNTMTNLRGSYSWVTSTSGKASGCTACGACEKACPQNIKIIDTMAKISELFD